MPQLDSSTKGYLILGAVFFITVFLPISVIGLKNAYDERIQRRRGR